MHRFFIPGAQPNHEGLLDLQPIAHQLRRVLRAAPGQEILVLDGSGLGYRTRLAHLTPQSATGHALETVRLPEPATQLTLLQGALKAGNFEWVLQKGVELGVACFAPVVTARAVVRPAAALEKKRPRWEAILREAAEQCGRGRIPRLAPAVDWPQALAWAASERDFHLKLMAWEETARPGVGQPAPALAQVVASVFAVHAPAGLRVACAIGPEGGFDAAEVQAAQAAGWQVVHLGPRILRAETAALAAVTLIMQACGEFHV